MTKKTIDPSRKWIIVLQAVLVAGLAGLGVVACVSALDAPEDDAASTLSRSRLPQMPDLAREPVSVSSARNSPTIFERPGDYTHFEKTIPHPTGPVNLLPQDDPLLAHARILGINWPMVANKGSSFVYPQQKGIVSYYHEPQILATGGKYDPERLTAAHKQLPFGTIVRCTRKDNGQSVVVLINDRGPYVRGRVLDLSRAAARKLGMLHTGIVPCVIEVLAYPLVERMGPRGNG